jgi:hypothetical protein
MTGTALERAPSAGAPAAYIDFDELHRRALVLAKAHQVIPKPFHDNAEAIVFVGMRGAELGFSLGYAIENIDVIEGRAVPNAQARLTRLRALGHEARFTESTPERATLRARRRENRDDPDAWVTFTYTIEDAIRAELAVMWVERKYRRDGDRYDRTEKYIVGDVVNGLNPELVAKATAAAEADAEARREAGNAQAAPNLWVKREVDAGRVKSKDNWRKDPGSMLRARCATNVCRMEFSDVMAGAGIDLYDAEEQGFDLDDEVAEGEVVGAGGPDAGDGPADVVDGEVLEDAEEAPLEEEPPDAVPTKEQVPEPQGDTPPHDTKSDGGTDSGPSDEGPKDEPARPLAQQIAIQANRAGVVRGEVILAVTNGRTSSGREVTPEEGAAVLQAIEAIARGDVALGETTIDDEDFGGERKIPALLNVVAKDKARPAPEPKGDPPKAKPVAPPAPGPPAPAKEPETPAIPDGEEDKWDGAQWRAFLTARDVKVRDLIRQAVKEAKELGVAPPANLEALKGQQSLCALLRGWVEELAESRAS